MMHFRTREKVENAFLLPTDTLRIWHERRRAWCCRINTNKPLRASTSSVVQPPVQLRSKLHPIIPHRTPHRTPHRIPHRIPTSPTTAKTSPRSRGGLSATTHSATPRNRPRMNQMNTKSQPVSSAFLCTAPYSRRDAALALQQEEAAQLAQFTQKQLSQKSQLHLPPIDHDDVDSSFDHLTRKTIPANLSSARPNLITSTSTKKESIEAILQRKQMQEDSQRKAQTDGQSRHFSRS